MQFKVFDIQIGYSDGIFSTTKGVVYFVFFVLVIATFYSIAGVVYSNNNPYVLEQESEPSYFTNFVADKEYFKSNIQRDTIVSPWCCFQSK